MPNIIEPASTGRAKCKGCARAIERGELRFGERLPNPFSAGERTLWFHLLCAAYKRPEPLLQTLGETSENIPDRQRLEETARRSQQHRHLPRIDGAERAPGSQASCRSCRQPIEKQSWRIRLVYFEEGMFTAGGFIHLDCRNVYFEAGDVRDQVLHFSSSLSEAELEELRRACDSIL